MKKRGLSNVVSSVILIALAIIAVGVVATYVVSFINNSLEDSGDCFEALDKVNLNEGYTCQGYDKLSLDGNLNDNDIWGCADFPQNQINFEPRSQIRVGIDVKDVEVEKFLIKVSSHGESKVYEIEEGKEDVNYANYLDDDFGKPLEFPKMNSGRTYIIKVHELTTVEQSAATAETGANPIGYQCYPVTNIELAPVINGKQCNYVSSVKPEQCQDLYN